MNMRRPQKKRTYQDKQPLSPRIKLYIMNGTEGGATCARAENSHLAESAQDDTEDELTGILKSEVAIPVSLWI